MIVDWYLICYFRIRIRWHGKYLKQLQRKRCARGPALHRCVSDSQNFLSQSWEIALKAVRVNRGTLGLRRHIRAARLRYYADHNFLARRLAAPALVPDRYHDAPPPRADDWSGTRSAVHPKLHKAWSEMVTADEDPPRTRERVRERTRSKSQPDRHTDLPLFTEHGPEPERDMGPDEGAPLGDDNVIDILRARF
jgi:hypothetical protein